MSEPHPRLLTGKNDTKVHKNDAISTPLAEADPRSTFWDLILQFEGNDVENEIQCSQPRFLTRFLGITACSSNGKIHILIDFVIMCLLMELFRAGQKSGGQAGKSILGKEQNIS